MAEDQWPSDNDRIASDEYLIAFGQVTLLYNLLRDTMERLFADCAPLEKEYANRIFHQLNNRDMIDLFSAFVRANEKDDRVKDVLQECILHYDICTENRNILMHVISDGISEATGIERFTKRASKNPARDVEFHVPLADLMLVADQIGQTVSFSWSIGGFLHYRGASPAIKEIVVLPPPLPGKPPKPRKLTPYQPPAVGARS
jgi:hypothetical protein